MILFSRKNVKFLSLVILLSVIVFFSARGANNPVRGAGFWLANPFLKTFRLFSGGVYGFFQFLRSIGDLRDENEKLIGEKQKLLAEIARLENVEKENELLRKELDLAPRNKYDLEASFVVGQDALGLGSSVFIDKGRDKGIREGMAVVVSNGILVGKVNEVFSNSAKVILLADPDSAVNGEVLESGAKGIIKGTYGLGISMEMISQAEVVKEGDTVITSGLGGSMPKGLLIGKIGQVGQSEDRLFQQATVFSPANLSSLRVVFVVKNF